MKQNLLFNRANAFGMRFIMVLTMLLLVGIEQAWGATAEFLPSHFNGQGTTSTGSAISATINGVTFKCDKGYGTTQIRCYSGSTIKISSSNTITAISFTFSDNKEGGLSASYTDLSTNSWETELSSQARITKCVVTYEEASADPCTVTLVPGSGSVTDTELEEPNAGEGVTLPTPTLDCGDWEFAGWKTTSAVTTETTTKPTLIAAGAYSPTSDITLYAVYQRTETTEGGGGSTPTEVSETYTFSDYEVGTQYAEETYELDDDVTINITGCHINTQLRVYGAQPGIVISEELPGRIVSMGFNMGYKADALVVSGSTDGTLWTEVGSISTTTSYKDYTLDFGETNYTYFKLNVDGSSQIRIASMSITWKSTSGGGSSSTTYYHSTPECSTKTLVTLHPNGGDGEETTATIEGTTYTVTDCSFTRDGYTFSHWDTQADDSGVDYDPDDIINLNGTPITLYAQWECAMASISISGAYALTQGQEFLLTATAKDSEGNEIECPDDAIYTWQYWDGSNWQDVNDNESSDKTKLQYASCNVVDHCGKFRCIISYGDCIAYSNTNTQDDGYKVHVYHIKGFGEWSTPYPFIYDANTGEAVLTMELEAYTTYEFSIFGSSTQFFNGGTITANATDWVYGLTDYGNTKITTTIAGVYIFTLDYSEGESNNLKLDVTYPSKRIIYLEPNIWGTDPKFAVHAWGGNSTEDILMTKIDDCASRNIYYAEIDASQTNVTFIRGNTDNYDISNPWDNVWNQTVDLTLGNDNLFYVDNWHDANDNNKSNGYWTTFTPNYLVTFDVQGHGTAPEDQCIAEGGTAITPTAPTATGYTFGGWYKEAGCTNAYDFSTAVTSSIPLYAKWTANIHTLTWDVNGGEALTGTYTSGLVAYGTVIIKPADPTRTGYTFNGWSPAFEEGTTMPDYDLTYTAQWKFIPTLQWSASSCTAALEADNDYPDLQTYPANLTGITYSSSKESVATIDDNTGEITLVGVGETIITASFAGNGTYAPAADASYTLTVVESNCRWVEIGSDATKIVSGSEVVITMEIDGYLYALPNNGGDNAPELAEVTEEDILMGSVANTLLWDVEKAANNYLTFHPINSSDNLFFNKADDGVRIGSTQTNATISHEFIISNSHLANIYTSRYLGIGTVSGEQKWKTYTTPTGNLTSQTLRIFQRECLDPTEVWVEGNLTNVTCTPQLPQQLAKNGSLELTITAADGYALPNEVTVTNAIKTWDQETGKLTISNPTDNVLVTINAVKLHTITWMVGSNSVLTEEVANETGVTQTPADPANGAIGECANAFMGWSETPLGSAEGQSAPADLCTAAQMKSKHTSVTGDKTFYAVFATAEGSATDFKRVTSLDELSDGISIVIASTKSSKFMTYSTAFGSSTWSESNGKITATDNMIFTLVANGDTWKIQKGTNVVSYEGRATSNPYCKPLLMNSNIKDWILVKNTSTTNTFTFYYEDGDYDYAIEYYSNESNWYAYSNKAPTSNDYYALALYVPDVTYSNYVTQCCTDWTPTLTYSKTTLDSETNETATPTITGNTHNAPVSFESSNTSVLTVDANNGTITAVGAGKATITATWAKTGDYCEKSITTDEITVNGNFLVTFHANDGSGNTTTQQIPSNTATALNANTFQRDGYTFQGWATSANGSKMYDDQQSVTLTTSGLDLYAVWKINAYQITIGTITGNGTITTSPASSANYEAQVTITATPAAHYTLTSVVVTRDDNSQTVAVGGNKFTMPASDVTITAEFTENEKFAINYAIPTGGGEVADDAPTWIYSDGSITLPGIKDGTISSEYFCEEFIGWTTLTSYESYEGAMPTPFYNAGDELSGITEATTLRPVYKRNGAGEGGTIAIGEEDMKSWNPNSLSSIAYGQPRSFTKGNFTWETTAMQQSSWGGEVQLDKNEEYYIKLPDLPGDLQSVTLDCRNGGSNTLTDGTFYLKDKNNVVIKESSVSPNNVCTFTDIPAGNSTAYLYAGVVSRILGITVTYGSPSIISTNLSCDYNVDEFTITYHTNFGTDVGQIPTGTVVNGACDNSGEPIRFEDLPNGEYTICNSLTATQYKLVGWNNQPDGNGGLTYRPGDVITAVSQSVITLYAQWVPEVIMLDNKDRTITYQETVGEAITLPAGAYTCDGKYTFVGWTTDNVDSWNQKITKPTLVAELDGNDETLFVPTEPTVVYAVYKLETTANSKAFYLKSDNNYYAQKHNTYVLKGTSDIADATRLYRQQINVESPNNYWLYYLDDEQQKRFVYINTADLGSLFSPSIGDGETTPEDTKGWEFVSVTGGYKLKALGTYGNSVGIVTHYMHTNESGNMRSNTTGSVYTIETATEINYYAYPTCSDEITITFETRGGTLIPNDHPYVLTKKEGDVITLPGCEYAGLDFIGWVNEPIEPTEIIANPEDIYEAEEEYVVGDQNIVLYAYYSQTPESAEYDGNSDGEWKIYAFANGEYHFAVAPNSEEDDMSTVTICDKSTTWTFTNVAENQYHIQDEAGRYVGVRPAIEDKNDFRFTDEPVIWTIESKGNDLYRLTCETNTDRVMLYDNGSIRYSSHTQEENPEYFYVTIGGCFNPIYTTDPARLQAVSVYGTVQITSTLAQTVKAMDKLTLVVRHAEPESYIRFSSPNVTFYDESGNVITTALVESQKQQIPLVVAYTPDVADNSIARPAITVTAKTLNPSTGTYVETNYSVNGRISARSLPADFAIVAKVGNMWYALPSQGLNSTDALVGYPVEVDNQNDPTAVTAVPENADWSLRQVYAASHSDAQKDRFKLNGANIMFENNASPAKMLNASSSDNYLLTNAEYDNYKQSDNQGLYEWTPTTTDLETYTLTNAGRTDKKLNVSVNTVFGVHTQNVATNSLRFLPIDERYTPLALQVVEWKENSIVVMYNGDPEQTASVSVNGGAAQTTTLSAAQRDIAVYELAANGLAANPTQRLSITIGTEKLLLPIPYIVNSNTTDATLTSNNKTLAAVSDLVVLNGKTFTADAATASKYTFRNVTIYGGGSLIIPSGKGLGVNSLTLRAGGITDAGEYDYVYPQFELRGTFTNSAAKINYDYITDYDHWYHFVLPFAGDLGTIKYPTEFYGANVVANNTGSWQIKRYAGEIRATGNYDAWVDIETEGKTSTTAGQGYIFWGAPKKVSVNGGDTQRQKWGIQRITMSVTADDAETEKADKILTGLSSHEDVDNKSDADNDQGWNLIGNPYMVNLKDMATAGLHACKLVEVIDPATGKWNGQWEWNDETDIRYLTIPSDHFDTYTAKTVEQSVPLVPGRAFFVQLEGEANAITFAAANRASLMPALLAENSDKPVDIETGIVLSNETLQDEVNFWIKDGKTNDYEYNADYPKTPNNNHFNIYGVHTNGDLSWVATGPEYAAESMPIGYQVPAAGTYMLSLTETYDSNYLEALYVTDHEMSPEVTTDLMITSYEFSVNQAETNNKRFTVAIKLKNGDNNDATGLDNLGIGNEHLMKFIYQDKIYILHHGVIYDATGKRVITINK